MTGEVRRLAIILGALMAVFAALAVRVVLDLTSDVDSLQSDVSSLAVAYEDAREDDPELPPAEEIVETPVSLVPGEPGRDGEDGRDGVDGEDGVDGQSPECLLTITRCVGATGAQGEQGPAGANGVDGVDGQDSTVPGPTGPQGPPGPPTDCEPAHHWTTVQIQGDDYRACVHD